jgi:hypothetical protein
MIGVNRLCARRKPIGAPIATIWARIGPIHARDCARPCRPSQFLCMHMYTHAQNGFADGPKQTACTLFHGHYFIDTDEMRFLRGTFFDCCTSPQIPLHTAQKIEVMCIIPQHMLKFLNHHVFHFVNHFHQYHLSQIHS